MGIFKAPIFPLSLRKLSLIFYHTIWNSNSYFLAKLLVNLVSVLPISNISVCADTEKNTILNAERNVK